MTLPSQQKPPRWTESLTPLQTSTMFSIVGKAAELGVEILPYVTKPVSVGPILTSYHVVPTGRTSVARCESLASDLAVMLHAEDVLVMRFPGDGFVSVGVPNTERTPIMWRDHCIVSTGALPLFLGINQHGALMYEDLVACPHMLIAGTTGSGKSTLLRSLLVTLTLSKVKFELYVSDTKQVEFVDMETLPSLKERTTSVPQTFTTIQYLLSEHNRRMRVLSQQGHKNISEAGNPWPFLLFVIDELADLTKDSTPIDKDNSPTGKKTTLGRLCEAAINELARKSRASGIHIIASTQRPSVDVVTGSIKANMPARLSFRLPSQIDSRTILDSGGAEHLLMRGDMLFVSPNRPGIRRIHAPFATAEDIKQAIKFASMKSGGEA